jgi:hypothetical protein
MVENEPVKSGHREERSDAAISLQAQPCFYEQMAGSKVRLPRFARNDLNLLLPKWL